jgi:hypothetical protein
MKIFSVFALIFVCTSCTKYIDINIPDEAPKLVVSAEFTSDSIWKVDVGLSGPSIGLVGPIGSINNAVILLKENGTELGPWQKEIELVPTFKNNQFIFDTVTHYIIPGLYPKDGKDYTLMVSAPQTTSVTAASKNVTKMNVTQITAKDSALKDDKDYYNEITFSMKDSASTKDYYSFDLMGLVVATPDTFYYPIRIFSNDIVLNENTDKGSINTPGVAGYDLRNPEFSDGLFSGENHTFKLYWTEQQRQQVYFDKIFIQIKHFSEEAYKYETSLRKQQNAKDNPFAEPVRIFSNIQNGIGVFGSYNTSWNEVVR